MAKININDLFGSNNAFGQQFLWQVGSAVVTTVLGPGLSELEQLLNEATQTAILSPADLADLVVRNYLGRDAAAAVAAKSGLKSADFDLLVKNAGAAPDTTTLIEAYRRKIISWDAPTGGLPSVLDGIREGRLADKWAPMLRDLGMIPLGVADAVDAVVEGQIDYAHGESIAGVSGVSADDFRILYNTRGNPPDLTQLGEMTRRGIIPADGTGPDVLSLTQGISEGATKDKWIPALKALLVTIPPEGTIRTLLANGALTDEQASTYWHELGYDDTITAGFILDAHHTKTATDRELAKGDILKLYADRVIDNPTATSLLIAQRYSAQAAAEILTIQDMHLIIASYDAAITRIRGYFIARKIDQTQVSTALDSLGVPTDQRTQLLTEWAIERDTNVRVLTEAQITSAWSYNLIDDATATSMLQATGLTAWEAWIVLSIKAKSPAFAEPAQGPNPLT